MSDQGGPAAKGTRGCTHTHSNFQREREKRFLCAFRSFCVLRAVEAGCFLLLGLSAEVRAPSWSWSNLWSWYAGAWRLASCVAFAFASLV
jgi:hypothetical protein